MADYYFLLDAALFEGEIRPAFAASWATRSFKPCQALTALLIPAADAYRERYHTGADETLFEHLGDLTFDRRTFRALVGETLLFVARGIPEFQTCADTLCCLLAPEQYRAGTTERTSFAPIQQAHLGTRDLTFGAAVYRPEYAGYNNTADVRRLADYLSSVRPEAWTVADLTELRDVEPDDRAEELEFAREWFPALVEMYRRAASTACVLVHESIY